MGAEFSIGYSFILAITLYALNWPLLYIIRGSPEAVAHLILQCCCTFHTTVNHMVVFFISFTTFRADFTSHQVNQSNKTYLLSCQVAGLLGLLESQEEAHYFGKWTSTGFLSTPPFSDGLTFFSFCFSFVPFFFHLLTELICREGFWPRDNVFTMCSPICISELLCLGGFICVRARRSAVCCIIG